MPLRVKKGKPAVNIKAKVEEISGVDLNICLQCRKCTNGCPIADLAESSPSEIIRQLQLDAGDDLLNSEIIWLCASCETCFARCPMEIDMASVMDSLRILARENGGTKPEGNAPLANKSMLNTIRLFGRTYDVGFMSMYMMGTSSYLREIKNIPTILKKRKIALFPPRGADKKIVKRIFKKSQAQGK